MGVRGFTFIGFFVLAGVLSLANPLWGIAAYAAHYHSYPENTYWGRGLAASGVRFSFAISSLLGLGTLLNLKRLPYGRLVTRQEALYLAFLAWMVIGRLVNGLETKHDAVDKMVKMAVFLLALTHVVVTPQRFERFFGVLLICSLYLGVECFTAPHSFYVNGRLEGVGGADFLDSNALAAHLVALLPIIGVQFLRGGWGSKALCAVAGALVANGVIQTRSRGGYIASLVCVASMLALARRGQRKRILILVSLGAMGTLTMVDSKYLERMETLRAGERENDESAMSRLRFWEAGIRMAVDNPLGVGPGNFHAHIGDYLPEDAGRDCHSTYVRCASELGWPGLGLLMGLIGNAFLSLSRVRRSVRRAGGSVECDWYAFGLQMSLAAYSSAAIFISATYIEMFWWLLLLPAALERAAANAYVASAG